MGVLCTWVKRLTDLQILGAVNCAPPDSLAVIRRMGGREGKERVCNRDTVFVSGRK